jgi:putative PIN family toxin of toxin-antitoxin system
MLKVVLDTNVLVSAYLVPGGKPARILSLARQGKLTICLSPPILSEVKQTLLRPKLQKIHKATAKEIERFLKALTSVVVMTAGTEEVDAVKDDPDDNKILACALEGKANFIVSGDHHLTDMKVFQGIPIVNPDRFLTFVSGRP